MIKRAIVLAGLFLGGCESIPPQQCQANYSAGVRQMHQDVINGTKRAFPGYEFVSVMDDGVNPGKDLDCSVNEQDLKYHREFILLRRDGEDFVTHVNYEGRNKVSVEDIEKLRPKREQCQTVNRPQNGGNHFVTECTKVYE